MVVEDDTDSDGDFELDVSWLWKVEIIPPFDSDGELAPVRLDDIEVDADGVDLGAVSVPERVRDRHGRESRGRCHWRGHRGRARGGFDHYVYTALTGNNGVFELNVPDVPLEVAFLPRRAAHRDLDRLSTGNVGWSRSRCQRAARQRAHPFVGGGVGAALVELMDADTGRSYGSALTDENALQPPNRDG